MLHKPKQCNNFVTNYRTRVNVLISKCCRTKSQVSHFSEQLNSLGPFKTQLQDETLLSKHARASRMLSACSPHASRVCLLWLSRPSACSCLFSQPTFAFTSQEYAVRITSETKWTSKLWFPYINHHLSNSISKSSSFSWKSFKTRFFSPAKESSGKCDKRAGDFVGYLHCIHCILRQLFWLQFSQSLSAVRTSVRLLSFK